MDIHSVSDAMLQPMANGHGKEGFSKNSKGTQVILRLTFSTVHKIWEWIYLVSPDPEFLFREEHLISVVDLFFPQQKLLQLHIACKLSSIYVPEVLTVKMVVNMLLVLDLFHILRIIQR